MFELVGDNARMPTDDHDETALKDWVGGAYLYRDPDYVEGSHPMDNDDVTWHHHWEKPPVKKEPPNAK